MKIFKQLNKKCYKHYYEGTVEELDSMDKDNQHLHSEIMQVIMWLYEKHGIWIKVDCASKDFWHPSIIDIENGNFKVHPSYVSQKFIEQNRRMFNSPTEAYEAAIDYTLNNLI